jgi:hypothetical protein
MITKKNTGYNDDPDIPSWIGYRRIVFSSSKELLGWINDNRETLELSDMIFNATIACFKENTDQLLVATLVADNVADIDVITKTDSFNEMVTIYSTKLLEAEQYEKLAEIKALTESIGLTFPKI